MSDSTQEHQPQLPREFLMVPGPSLRAILLVINSKLSPYDLRHAIRGRPGVRLIEAVEFHSAFSRGANALVIPPNGWEPTGVLVFIEAETPAGFQRILEDVTAHALGTKVIRLSPMDNG